MPVLVMEGVAVQVLVIEGDSDEGAGVDPRTMMPPMYGDGEGPFVSQDVDTHDAASEDVPTPKAPTAERPHVSTA